MFRLTPPNAIRGPAALPRKNGETSARRAPPKRETPVTNTGNPCIDNDADHRMELVLGGANECHNMTPCNASVNRSCGSQIGRVLRDPANAGGVITKSKPQRSALRQTRDPALFRICRRISILDTC